MSDTKITVVTSTSVSTDASAQHPHSKRAVVEDIALLSLGRYLALGLSFVISIVQKRLLGPYLVGVWQLLSIFRQYLSYGDVGISRGAEQKLPPLYRSRQEELDPFRDAAYTFTLLPVIVINALILAATFVWPWQADPLILWGFRGMAVIAIVESGSNIMEVSALRSRARFRLLSLQVFGSEVLFAVLSIPGILLWGIYGLLGAVFASLSFKIGFMYLTTGEWFRLRWDFGRATTLWRLGFPLTVFVVLFKTFDMLDRILLIHGGSLDALGYYSIATMATVSLGHFPLIIASVFFPRTMTWFQVREYDDLGRYLRQAQLCVLVLMGIVVGLCYFLMPLVVHQALPTFAAGIPALKISIFSAIFVGLVHLPIQYQIASNKQWALVWVMALATAAYYGTGIAWFRWVGASHDWLLFVASSRVVGYSVLWAVIGIWTFRRLKSPSALRGHAKELVSLAAYMVGLTVGIDYLLPLQAGTLGTNVVRVLEQIVLFGLGLWPVLAVVERQTGVLSTARSIYTTWQSNLLKRLIPCSATQRVRSDCKSDRRGPPDVST